MSLIIRRLQVHRHRLLGVLHPQPHGPLDLGAQLGCLLRRQKRPGRRLVLELGPRERHGQRRDGEQPRLPAGHRVRYGRPQLQVHRHEVVTRVHGLRRGAGYPVPRGGLHRLLRAVEQPDYGFEGDLRLVGEARGISE